MNTFMNALSAATNYTYTENGALTYRTTNSALLDMFALGGAMRNRPDEDVILMFRNAFDENPVYALKCLFYLRDIRGGQGQRRFFRVVMRDLARYNADAVKRNIKNFPIYGRWDDLYCLEGTPLEADAFKAIQEQLMLDVQCKTPSLLAKWLKSENTSSAESRRLAAKTRRYLGFTHKQYRKTLSILRERINVLERLMSAGKWDEIEFDKIPSRAGLIYKNAFARHDLERTRSEARTYEDFIKDENTKVNAEALYPYEVVAEALKLMPSSWSGLRDIPIDDINRLAVNKYWDNLHDYFQGATLNAIAVVDTSGSMWGNPINVAISLGLYCAEKNSGPFANHYISFASRPQLIKTEGIDFYDKVARIYNTNLIDNTNIEAVFDLLLNTAKRKDCKPEDMPKSVVIISDMEFDCARRGNCPQETLMEGISRRWENSGYQMPELVFWNVNARQNNIAMTVENGITFVSGMSPVIFEMLMSGKTSYDLMFDKLNSERYAVVR